MQYLLALKEVKELASRGVSVSQNPQEALAMKDMDQVFTQAEIDALIDECDEGTQI